MEGFRALKLDFLRSFLENVDFAKIVLSLRRRAHFQGLEPPKTDQKTSQNRCKDAFEKNAENPRPIWCHWVVQNFVSGPTWRRWACQKRRHQLPWCPKRRSKAHEPRHGAPNGLPGLPKRRSRANLAFFTFPHYSSEAPGASGAPDF